MRMLLTHRRGAIVVGYGGSGVGRRAGAVVVGSGVGYGSGVVVAVTAVVVGVVCGESLASAISLLFLVVEKSEPKFYTYYVYLLGSSLALLSLLSLSCTHCFHVASFDRRM